MARHFIKAMAFHFTTFITPFPAMTQVLRPHSTHISGLLLGLWLCAAGATPSRAQSDNFNDGNDVAWSHYDPLDGFGLAGLFTFPNGGYRIQTLTPSQNPSVLGPGRCGSLRPFDSDAFYLAVDLVDWNDALPQAVGLLARIRTPGLGTTTGYTFTWSRETGTNDVFDITKITGEAPDDVPTVGDDQYHLVPGRKYRLVFTGEGSRLEGRLYELPDIANALVTIVGFDTTWDEGVSGLLVYDNSGLGNNLTDATFDNFASYTQDRPPLAISRPDLLGVMTVSWPYAHHLAGFKLQWTDSLAPISWNDVPAESVVLDPASPQNVSHQTTPSEDGQKFFRLMHP